MSIVTHMNGTFGFAFCSSRKCLRQCRVIIATRKTKTAHQKMLERRCRRRGKPRENMFTIYQQPNLPHTSAPARNHSHSLTRTHIGNWCIIEFIVECSTQITIFFCCVEFRFSFGRSRFLCSLARVNKVMANARALAGFDWLRLHWKSRGKAKAWNRVAGTERDREGGGKRKG